MSTFTPLGCKEIGISIFEFMKTTQRYYIDNIKYYRQDTILIILNTIDSTPY